MDRRDFIRTTGVAALAAVAGARGALPSRRVRVAQLGTQHAHAEEKWATLQRLRDDFECVGVCEPDADLRRRAQADPAYAGARWLEAQELFALRDLDAVAVESELPDLLRLGRQVVDAGWHLHLDKPGSRDLAGFVALQDEAAAKGRVVQLGYMYRYHPSVRWCLEAAARGWLGPILAAHGEMGRAIPAARRPWLAEHYGGAMLFLGGHLVDLVVGLMGAPKRVARHARKSFPARDDFSDHELVILEYPQGLATVRSMLAEPEGGERRQFVVIGENATVEIKPLEPARLRVAFQRPPDGFKAGYQDVELPGVGGRYDEQLRDFARQVRGERSVVPQFDPAHDRRVLELLLP